MTGVTLLRPSYTGLHPHNMDQRGGLESPLAYHSQTHFATGPEIEKTRDIHLAATGDLFARTSG